MCTIIEMLWLAVVTATVWLYYTTVHLIFVRQSREAQMEVPTSRALTKFTTFYLQLGKKHLSFILLFPVAKR